MIGCGPPFWGKYRGTVISNIDPEFRGRLLCMVPDVLPTTWVEACVPLSGAPGLPMGAFFLPPTGTGVWIEFEQGDPDKPIWVGCQWGAPTDVPPIAKAGLPVSPSIVLQTGAQNKVVISDLPGPAGGVMIQSGMSMISINTTGVSIVAPRVSIDAGEIKLNGITNINNGALMVTL